MNPLHQRHSYNQGNGGSGQGGGGLCNGTTGAHYHGPPSISQPSLRRIIKPPARFRNARMSLRLRARPVLCAKCKSLCDDKADSGSKQAEESSGGGGGESNQKGKKDNQPKTKLSNKNNSGDGESESSSISTKVTSPSKHGSSRMNGKLQGDEPRQTNCVTEPADLRYESVGSTGVVENYWRRPLVKPLIASTEETYARLRKHKGSSSSSSTTGSSSTSGRRVKNSSNAVAPPPPPEKLGEESPGEYLTKSAIVCDTNNFPNTRSRKALNLKMCISKIAERRKKDKGGGSGILGKPLGALIKLKDHASLTNTLPVSPLLLQNQSDSSVESTEEMMDNNNGWSAEAADECVGGGGGSRSSPKKTGKLGGGGGGKKSKDWENRMRTKSTVPVRYRDESYLTKNDIFNFHNKRKKPLVNSKSGRESGGDIPVLTISRRDDDENTFKVTALSSSSSCSEHMESQANDQTVTTSKIIDDSEESDEENEEEDEQEENNGVAVHSTVQLASSSTISPEDEDLQSHHSQSPCSSSSTLQSDQLSIKTSSTTELIKTPTIKITFGSSGNGMVVQIPPKVAQNPMCATSGGEDNPMLMGSTHHLKHVRKAMKKAKKEAKRRRSNSPSPSSSNAMSPPTALEAQQHPLPPPIIMKSLLSQSSSLDVSNDQEASSSQQDDMAFIPENRLCDQLSSGEPSTYSSSRTAKKRKKEKKRRRGSKALKENDSGSNGSSHQSTSSNSTTSSSAFLNASGLADGDDVASHPENIADSSSPPAIIALELDPPQNPKRQTFPAEAPSASPPRRRRSMPATSSSSGEAPRVCINLKRIDSNAYVPLLPLSSSHSDNDDPSFLEESTSANGQALLDRDDTELNEFPLNTADVGGSPHRGADFVGEESVDYYKDKETECCYRRGDVVWGKLGNCPWWPGKVCALYIIFFEVITSDYKLLSF